MSPYCMTLVMRCARIDIKNESLALSLDSPNNGRMTPDWNEVDDPWEGVRLDERTRRRIARYGLSERDYFRLLETQSGVCGICHEPMTHGRPSTGSHHWVVDHNDETGVVRGLVHQKCNLDLARYGDTLRTVRAHLVAKRRDGKDVSRLKEIEAYLVRTEGKLSRWFG
jgi:hypothetical protein